MSTDNLVKKAAKRTPSPVFLEFERRFDFRSLFEFTSIVNASTDLSFILGHLLLTIMGKLLSTRGIILIGDEDTRFRIRNIRGLPDDLVGSDIIMKKIPRRILHTGKADGRKYPWLAFFRKNGIETIIPMTQGRKIVGIAGFAPNALNATLTVQQEEYLESLGNIAAAAIVRSIAYRSVDDSNRELNRKIQELNTLFELSKELNALLDPERMVKLLMFSVMGQIGAHRCFLSLKRDDHLQHVISRTKHRLTEAMESHLLRIAESQIVGDMNRPRDRQCRDLLTGLGIEVVIPLRAQNEMKGLFGVGGRLSRAPFEQSDLDFLSSLGNLAVIALENTRLFRDALEKQKLEDELMIAREIQRGLLPAELPAIPGFAIAATNISSKQVGGDYYDVIDPGSGRYVIAIGDVAGKGPPASLLMATLQASIRALVPLGLSLSELTGRVNDLMLRNTSHGKFITFFWGILDTGDGVFHYVNAGHNPPLLVRGDGSVERLEIGGLILGILPTDTPYEQGIAKLGAGDTLLLYTDGVSEAMNTAGEEFGEERILSIMRKSHRTDVGEIQDTIVDAVTRFSGEAGQADDITLVVVRRTHV